MMIDGEKCNFLNEYNDRKTKYINISEYIVALENIEYYYIFLDKLIRNCHEPYIMVPTFNNYIPKLEIDKDKPLSPIFEFLKTIEKLHTINLISMFDSLKSTLYTIYRSMEVLNISDAFALLRKFKDDYLLTILFSLLGTTNQEKSGISSEQWKAKKDLVYKFAQNSMNDLYAKELVEFISNVSLLKELDTMKEFPIIFKKMADLMNKYTHSHGLLFINSSKPNKNLDNTIQTINNFNQYLDTIMVYLTSIMLYLNPRLVVSDEHIANSGFTELLVNNSKGCNLSYLKDFVDERVLRIEPKFYDLLSNKIFF